jgi:DNA mismatch repair protein MutS
MFAQYFDLKERYPDSLLLFRCGDFYEMYGDDAVEGARLMEIALTTREVGKEERIAMAGVPHHALDNYMRLLIGKGRKVAVCEQLEDPKKVKGLVKRDVTRVITSGTVMDPQMLPADQNNFLLAVASLGGHTGIAVADISTGDFRLTDLPSRDMPRLQDEIFRIRPSEVLLYGEIPGREEIDAFLGELSIPAAGGLEPLPPENLMSVIEGSLGEEALRGIDWDGRLHCLTACAALVEYLNQTQKTSRHSFSKMEFYDLADYMVLDATTWRNLEISHTMMERGKKGSLLWVIDETRTGMGARLLRSWLERPLLDPARINARLDGVAEMAGNYTLLTGLSEKLKSIYDLERIISRVIYGSAGPRDLLALRNSLLPLPGVKRLLQGAESSMLHVLLDSLDVLEDVCRLVSSSISEDAPVSTREGSIITPGYSLELDELREARHMAKEWIAELERKERDRTGIKSLKIRFNSVFGYYIEVTRPNLPQVPPNYIRKQTIANGERFISPELKEYEAKILGCDEKILELEYNLFIKVRESVSREADRIQKTSRVIAALDALASLASVAVKNGYCRPDVSQDGTLKITGGRHPVVEKCISSGFVANDTLLDGKGSRFHMITGPNMSGKSTYLRQVGLIAIMAQVGSFVPARSAHVGIVDRVFTRVGASDDLHMGKSTFLVEMSETANIINNASRRSLILLDEIGRGTSTYDGLSIAWAVSEHIHDVIGARSLFATHFHQLTQLAGKLEGVKNFRVEVKETSREIIFLHRIVPGGTDRSYGIYVARLAGLPMSILNRAGEILESLEASHGDAPPGAGEESAYQLTFFDLLQSPLMEEIRRINPDDLSPRDALERIYQWKRNLD